MSKKLLLSLTLVVGLWTVSSLWAADFELIPTLDIMIGNDSSQGADSSDSTGTGMHVRDVDTRRRAGYAVYDLSEVKELGAVFSDLVISSYGHDSGDINVYGVLEEYEDLVTEDTTWSTAPGVNNDQSENTTVEIDETKLSELLLTFDGPSKGEREETDVCQELTDFFNADTTGVVVLMFAPPESGNAILRTIDYLDDDDEILGGSWIIGSIGGSVGSATAPTPADAEDDVYNATSLTWSAGAYAATHKVYLSMDFNEVNEGLASALVDEVTETEYTPTEVLALGQTYYWRVDEVNEAPDDTVYPGTVWEFTVEEEFFAISDVNAVASSCESDDKTAANLVDGSGLESGLHGDDSSTMWLSSADDETPTVLFTFPKAYSLAEMVVWNYNAQMEKTIGFSAKDIVVETSLNGDDWVVVEGITELAKGPGEEDYEANNVFDMNSVLAQYVRFTLSSNHTLYPAVFKSIGLSEVQFTYLPTNARVPTPEDEATDIDLDLELQWRAGRGAIEHQVYLGTDANQVAARDTALLLDTVADDELAVDGLMIDTTYYWAVDAVHEDETVEGDLWSFSTLEYVELETFDSYSGDCTRIYWFWRDGAGYDGDDDCGISSYNGNGSSGDCYVGYANSDDNGSFAETSIVYEGAQSMPFEYANGSKPYYSEAVSQDGLLPTDWTVGSVENLTLFVQGRPAAVQEVSADNLIISGGGEDIYSTVDEFRYVYKTLDGDGSIVARVVSLENTNGWAKAGVMIRRSLDDYATNAMIYVSPENGIRFQERLSSSGDSTSDTSDASDEQKAAEIPVWLKLVRSGDTFTAFYALDEEGTEWVAAAGNSQEIAMSDKVYIGLAVCSHDDSTSTVAEFTDITTTGSVSGSWTPEDVGVEQLTNEADVMYVTVTDNSGESKTVMHENEAATQIASWEQWDISLSTLSDAGVNLSSVASMTIGVGTGDSSGGSGIVFIDEIRLTRFAD